MASTRICKSFLLLVLVLTCALTGCTPTTSHTSALDRALAQADSIGPVRRIAITSATQAGMLHALGESGRIVAVANADLYYNLPDSVRRNATELGNDFELNIEQTILTHPDLVLMTDYGFRTQGIEQVEKAGIPVLYLAEWREEDPIRRSEWLRVLGILTGQSERADSIIAVAREGYERLKAIGADIPQRHSLAAGQSYRGTWYVPTAGTYMGRLIADAGADYCFLSDTTTASIPLTLEEAIMRMADAEFWIGAQAETLDELAAIDSRHTWMRAYRDKKVYTWDRARNATGGNDFWETGVVRPDYILADLIWALYPERMEEGYEPRFIRKLE